jgi:hypothetical protein
MAMWEYDSFHVPCMDNVCSHIDDFGSRGWEANGIVRNQDKNVGGYIILLRRTVSGSRQPLIRQVHHSEGHPMGLQRP